MNERRPPQELVEGLISQDRGLTESQFKEFRMNLEQNLEQLERRAESSRRATIRAVGALIVCSLFAFVMNMTQAFTPHLNQIIAPIWSVCTNIALVTTGVLVVRYWTQHRPALERGRIDLQIAMFGELQRQIAALNERLGQRPQA